MKDASNPYLLGAGLWGENKSTNNYISQQLIVKFIDGDIGERHSTQCWLVKKILSRNIFFLVCERWVILLTRSI